MRTEKQNLAAQRNWELLQVGGIECNIKSFQFKYPVRAEELMKCLHLLQDLRITIINSYKEKLKCNK